MFSNRPSRFTSGQEPWFKIGGLDVGSSVLVAGVIAISMFITAAEGPARPLTSRLVFDGEGVLDGEVWRLISWWIPNRPSIWRVLTIVYVAIIGSQLEGALGRARMALYFGYLTFVPALIATVLTAVGLSAGGYLAVNESSWLSLSLLFTFVAYLPGAQFFFGIPGWVLALVIAVIDLLQFTQNRLEGAILWYLLSAGAVLLLAKAFGLAESITWIPKVPLPSKIGGDPAGRIGKPSRRPSAPTLDDPLEEIEINAILDHVSEKGLHSLSRAQKRKLKAHGNKRRRR